MTVDASSTIAGPAGLDEEVDPFTTEIIADSLRAISDEMFLTTQRTSQSPIIYEVLDFSVGITDPAGRLVSQGNGVTLFLGTLDRAVESVIAKFGLDGLAPGDLILTNDPYGGGGTHLSDVTVVGPVHYEGEIIGFAANKAHWSEVGGKDPGSMSVDATEVFQEGLQLPCVKVVSDGVELSSVIDIIRENVRTPDQSIGDLRAQMASVRLAAQSFAELSEKYGVATIRRTIDHMIEHAERAAEIEIAKLPPGEYEAEDFIDGGEHQEPIPIKVKVTISDSGVVCDFTGTAPASPTSVNCSRTGLICGARTIFKAIMGPDVPANAGTFGALEIVCPEGTVFTAVRPSPTSAYWDVVGHVSDLVQKALAPVLPARLPAGHYNTAAVEVIAGDHPESGEFSLIVEVNCGGWGGAEGKDGERGLVALIDGETYIIPVEIIEQRYGVVVEEYAFNTEDPAAGAGRWRGGNGIVREFRMLSEHATVTGFMARHEHVAWGVAGGHDGSRNEIQVLDVDGTILHAGGLMPRVPVTAGQRVRVITGSGGGWGDPAERDPDAVAADVRDGFISADDALRVYGVTVGEDGVGRRSE